VGEAPSVTSSGGWRLDDIGVGGFFERWGCSQSGMTSVERGGGADLGAIRLMGIGRSWLSPENIALGRGRT
jgi:hypothetical protein